MSFFDDVVSKAKKAADTVGKGAGNVIDSGKLKVNEAELKGEVKKSYEALGKLVYEAKLDGSDASAQVDEAVSAINELKQKLADIEAQLLKLAKKAVCKNCGEINPIDASFCAKCGAKIEKEVVEAAEAEVCADCGCGCCEEAPAEDTEEKAE
ncbi:MAG: zinc-ribbon domain-containing protein [Oscillospiraceae bacterium]|nr:zinc-ribbon domain-containing protein [Oscillospiraceae bacterium]